MRGFDTDIRKIPIHLLDAEDPVSEFNKQIIDATKDYVWRTSLTSLFESMGVSWKSLQKPWIIFLKTFSR